MIQCAGKQPGHMNVSANLDIRNLQKITAKVGFYLHTSFTCLFMICFAEPDME